MPGARAALLLLAQRQKLEADEERRNTGQVAIVVRVRLGVTTADEGVRGDQLAAAELRIALRLASYPGRARRAHGIRPIPNLTPGRPHPFAWCIFGKRCRAETMTVHRRNRFPSWVSAKPLVSGRFGMRGAPKPSTRRNRVSRKINGSEFQCGIADARKRADLLAFPARACARCKKRVAR